MKLLAKVKTEKADKYKTVMARHFARKVKVDWLEHQACIHFPVGNGYLEVQGSWLEMTCEAETEEKLLIVKRIIDSHFKQFTHRESLILDWQSRE